MKIGVCCGKNNAETVKSIGYDYIEENLTHLATISDSEFSELCEKYKSIGIPVYSTNCFFPGNLDIYDEEKAQEVTSYVEKALSRANALDVKVCVLGSGKVRAVPEGADPNVIKDKFAALSAKIGRIASKYGISIAIEALRYEETNVGNTVRDVVELAEKANEENVGILVDFFHFFCNKEPYGDLTLAKKYLIHTHIARPNADRRMPTEEDVPTVKKWAELLSDIEYSGNISLEGGFDANSLALTYPIIKKYFI
ncbi:MAG: sugar phosphate isomerase/epimerase [Ruminococcaceae bacterium]|nr:sugar phosphate isomerase/epimerase [Oscillospiraceae bacterium]